MMPPRKPKPKKRKEPLFPGLMIPVTDSNRQKLAKELGWDIPSDVEYVIDDEGVLSDEFIWAAEPKERKKPSHPSIEEVD